MKGESFRGVASDSRDWDIHDDPEYRRWERDVKTRLVPKLHRSDTFCAVWDGKTVNVKIAVELGMALLMGKPLIFAVAPGVDVPAGLARAANVLIEDADPSTEEGMKRLAREVQIAIESLRPDDGADRTS